MRSEAIRLVKGAFDRAGVVMPEPIYNLRFGAMPMTLTEGAAPAGPGKPAPERAVAAGASAAAVRIAEPAEAIDIAPRDDLDDQIAADRREGEDDLLRHRAKKE